MKEDRLEPLAQKALQRCLREVPFVYGQAVEKDSQVDLVARLALPQKEQVLLVEVKGSGQPRQVRQALDQLHRLRQERPEAYPVIVAPYISPRSAELCAREGVGYLDLAGNCRLAFGQVYIQREGIPNPAPRRSQLRSLYAPKASRVLRALLAQPGRPWKMEPLAQEAEVSLGQTANVKRLLADREWIGVGAEGFWLSEPGALLEEWASVYSYRKNQARDYYTLLSPEAFEKRLAQGCVDEGRRHALTAFSAAARIAPAVRYRRSVAYVEGSPEPLVERLELRPAASGANVRLLQPYDEGVFYDSRMSGDVAIVSPVQAYLDLQGAGGRGEEAARALLEEVIRPSWHQPT